MNILKKWKIIIAIICSKKIEIETIGFFKTTVLYLKIFFWIKSVFR